MPIICVCIILQENAFTDELVLKQVYRFWKLEETRITVCLSPYSAFVCSFVNYRPCYLLISSPTSVFVHYLKLFSLFSHYLTKGKDDRLSACSIHCELHLFCLHVDSSASLFL
mmetsp:Transcript_18476/g.46477  ORF Transcript_18476/g.46477 Transcript_18476/m.46477 type:complete len:113 (+) Transcript_18476:136-474(+)